MFKNLHFFSPAGKAEKGGRRWQCLPQELSQNMQRIRHSCSVVANVDFGRLLSLSLARVRALYLSLLLFHHASEPKRLLSPLCFSISALALALAMAS